MAPVWKTPVGMPSAVGGIVGSTAVDASGIYGPVTTGGYLWSLDGKQALFDDHAGAHGMSETFQNYLAGLIATAQEFSLLWAPTVNSYKRFQPGSWAPTGIGWGAACD